MSPKQKRRFDVIVLDGCLPWSENHSRCLWIYRCAFFVFRPGIGCSGVESAGADLKHGAARLRFDTRADVPERVQLAADPGGT